jgi:hypothetical protein
MVIASPEGEDSVYTYNLKYIQTHNRIMWKYIIIGVDSVNFVWYFGDIYKRHKDWKSTVIVNTTDLYYEVTGILYIIILRPNKNIDETHVESG